MSYIVVIPARLKSTRLKEKLLIKIGKDEILKRTYNKCLKVISPKNIIIATDSKKIIRLCEEIGARYFFTKNNCLTGTDRVAEVAKKIKKKYYINVQGDEPFLDPTDLKKMINALRLLKEVDVINGYSHIKNNKEYLEPSIPKLVFNEKKELIYMSRAPIPSSKNKKFTFAHKQICIYGFKRKPLLNFKSISKSKIEKKEDIEILRFIEKGYKLKMVSLSGKSFAIDTIKDLKKAKKFLDKK